MQDSNAANQTPDVNAALKKLSEGCHIITDACALLTEALEAKAAQANASSEPQSTQTPDSIVYHPRHVQQLLGIKRGVYYKIVKQGLLPYTRLYDGGPRVHLASHVRLYEESLRERAVKPQAE